MSFTKEELMGIETATIRGYAKFLNNANFEASESMIRHYLDDGDAFCDAERERRGMERQAEGNARLGS